MEDDLFEIGGVLGITEKELQGDIRVAVIVDVSEDFIIVAVCPIGLFVRAIGPFHRKSSC